ncbi:hypothetical protein AC579_6526 [Pseudocercospora musae]|uniref:Amidase domain-containing protein n=1 Tax=Pseudocercospora musae TaxID=113226 RepID=A0A139I113_9PEZI|nr:hypothetical protein AC579_6526 [Pseudocercospora musae]KXT08422.1 hypothetical protein AC579_6526 [Pseudocercospora musae]KXT08423.1 hypothetical protein AC579_6526 [Pseudocercospora musae]
MAVQHLIDAGAVVVRKIHSRDFATGKGDRGLGNVHAPFNQRETPGSISVFSRACCWNSIVRMADLAPGSDTGGSVRSSSQVYGVCGNRRNKWRGRLEWYRTPFPMKLHTGHGLVNLDHTMAIAPELDNRPRTSSLVQSSESALWAQHDYE